MPNPTNQINARDWSFQVLAVDGITWLDIAGITKFTLKRNDSEVQVDTTVFASQGTEESQPMQRSGSLDIEGRYILSSGNVRDVGQARIEVLGFALGDSALGQLRFKHTVQTLWTVWNMWVSLADVSGGNNDKVAWGFRANKTLVATTM